MIDINNLELYREDNRIEAKKAKSQLPDSIWETYSAFANTDGGIILLGVTEREDKSLAATGVQDAYKLITDFWNTVNNKQKVSINILTNKMVYEQEVDGKTIVVIEVPRAERAIRPVYLGQDPMKGTYLRFWEGDHLCDREQVSAFYRDAAATTEDMKVLKGLDLSVFDMQSVRDYRNYFDGRHSGHIWSKQEDEMFLRSIGAMGFDREDGKAYPTLAGLLMFGREYDIVRECPNYFLDYREVMEPDIRWTHRLVSSSGDWSGNLFDFFFHVYNRMKKAFPVPFKLDEEGARIDDTPMHKALREMVTNTLAHADYYGRQGTVIIMKPNLLSFANPGDMRTGLKAALNGGASDARNSTIMKMFSLLDFGDRAGSGIPDIIDICRTEMNAEPQYKVTYSPARTEMTIDIANRPSTAQVAPNLDGETAQVAPNLDGETVQVPPNLDGETAQVPPKYRPSTAQVEKMIEVMGREFIYVSDIMALCGIARRKTIQENYITPAINDGTIEREFPENPKHPKQRYRLSEMALEWKKTVK